MYFEQPYAVLTVEKSAIVSYATIMKETKKAGASKCPINGHHVQDCVHQRPSTEKYFYTLSLKHHAYTPVKQACSESVLNRKGKRTLGLLFVLVSELYKFPTVTCAAITILCIRFYQ